MKFSVITPSLNGLADLKRAVGSVRGQTGVALEHIVQDGQSTDGTPAWLAKQEGVIHSSEPDGGMYEAINRGWAKAQGDVLSWLNVDEQYLPGTLAHVHAIFESNADIDVVFGDVILVNTDGAPVAARREIPLRAFYVKNLFLYAFSAATFFRRDLWDTGLLEMDASLRMCGDADTMLRLLAEGKRVAHTPRYLSLFGIGNNMSMTQAHAHAEEADRVARKHHALPPPLRILAKLGRTAERALHGCYRTDTVSYCFAVDETPSYREISGERVSAFFSYNRVRPGRDGP